MRKHNFSAGPAILPLSTLENASKAVMDINGIGMSLLEISHRGKDFKVIIEEAETLVKELLKVPSSHSVLFLQGGASTQFCMVPYNLLDEKGTAAYLETGVWSKKAIKEAKIFGNVETVASSSEANFNYIPKDYSIPENASYFHITTNNTIFGTQIHQIPDTPIPLVADMSSDIFCKSIDVSRFSLIYAGAQKNLGPAGVTLVIIDKSILGKVDRKIPSMLDYQIHIDNNSLYNTPPVFAIYASFQTLKWIKDTGGLKVIEKNNIEKANKIYDEIDRNSMFKGTAVKEDRSIMNATFVMEKEGLEEEFLNAAKDANIEGIKGHRSVGGFRASIYNAMPVESIDALIELMQTFEKKHS